MVAAIKIIRLNKIWKKPSDAFFVIQFMKIATKCRQCASRVGDSSSSPTDCKNIINYNIEKIYRK